MNEREAEVALIRAKNLPYVAAPTETLATYTLELIGPGPIVGYERDKNDDYGAIGMGDHGNAMRFERYEGIRPSLLRETEENLTDLLPEGYSVRIREWDE